jgi:sugar diacid utilization regulator
MGTDSVQMTIESGTILASTNFERDGQKVNGAVEMKAAEAMVIDIDP